MIHGSRSGLLNPGLRRITFLAPKWGLAGGRWICLFLVPKWRLSVEGRSTYFWLQNGTLLWRFRNSFTRSSNLAKCSNILQDNETKTNPLNIYSTCKMYMDKGLQNQPEDRKCSLIFMIAALGYGNIFYWHSLNIWVTKSQNNRILLGLDEEMLDSFFF